MKMIFSEEGFDMAVLFIVIIVIFSVVSSNKCNNSDPPPPGPESDYYTKQEVAEMVLELNKTDSLQNVWISEIETVSAKNDTLHNAAIESSLSMMIAADARSRLNEYKIEDIDSLINQLGADTVLQPFPEYFVGEQLSDSVWRVIRWYINEEDTATIIVYPYPVLKDTTFISWDANPDSEGVKVYRVFVKSAVGVDTIYVGPKTFKEILTKYLPYDELGFFIKAYDNARNESAPSDTVKMIRKRE